MNIVLKSKQKVKGVLTEGGMLWNISERLFRFFKELPLLKGKMGGLPSFMIIGVQKGGTSSLYHYLIQHPDILSAVRKEPSFFSGKIYQKGLGHYRSFFPFSFRLRKGKITGEASTSSMINPHTASRVKKHLPQMKIIALLRDPAERAYSHYAHEKRRGHETLSFSDALLHEELRITQDFKRLEDDANYDAYNYHKYAYFRRGCYALDLKPWYDEFDPEQILVLKSEDLFSHPQEILNEVFSFLGVKEYTLKEFDVIQRGWNKKEVDLHDLRKRYESWNKQLTDLTGKVFRW